jgi:hypothetical protein
MQAPDYFHRIEQEAQQNWELLDGRPAIAGPWHQLFRQVQSPRHVVSELLQNANDAGARSASVRIEDNTFVFEHDGDDFDADQFGSLCRFGFSNKRTLHTIGFRGVGFKSTFSLGDTVEVQTPTLAVSFKKKRFTQPIWISGAKPTTKTIIRVRIGDRNRISELKKNFKEWAESPASLLFFNSLKELNIDGQPIERQPMGNGPVPESKWVKLIGAETQKLLVIRSEALPFSDDAAEEIRSERGIQTEELQFPPCRVELVLGLSESNRLYVVLPTGAEVTHPFSCNGPFIQDPARFAIKDPATSPTNRWLLERAGRLAGRSMLEWLGNDSLTPKERARAYELLHVAGEFDSDLDGACSQIISESMMAELDDRRVVLTTAGKLVKSGECVALPAELFNAWDSETLTKLFASGSSRVLAPEVSQAACKALDSHSWIDSKTSDEILTKLETTAVIPRPDSWPQLHALWTFVENEINYDHSNERRRRLKIVPVDGSKALQAASGVVRLSSRRDLLSPADWKFVMDYAPTLDGEWLGWLGKRGSKKSDRDADDPGYELLQALGLHEPSAVDRIVAQASLRLFTGKTIALAECVRIAHIMAALGAAVPAGFRYVTKDRLLRETKQGVVVDESGRHEDIVPASWAQEHLLNGDYSHNFTSCRPDTWASWIRTTGSGLLIAAPVAEHQQRICSRRDVTRFAAERGANQPKEFHYRTENFNLIDYVFPFDLLKHWRKLSESDPAIWAGVLEGILTAPVHHWKAKTQAEVRHEGTTYYKTVDCGGIPAAWVLQLRSVPCLPDTHGKLRVPAELLLRTPDTEPLMGVEPFVRAELDTPSTSPLLKLLGVRDTPTGADKLLGRLHALSAVAQPISHISQISRLYEALDRIAVRCSRPELDPIIEAFSRKAIILTDSGEWMTAGEVSIFPDDDNQSPTIHASLRTLGLWPRIGVSERPALEHTIEWLKSLASGTKLDISAARRIRAALQRDPIRIWNECGCWLSLDSTWEDTRALKYRLTMQGLMKWGELFTSIKTATANLQMLGADVAQLSPFDRMLNLADAVEFRVTRFNEPSPTTKKREWLASLADGLARAKFPNDEDTGRVRSMAQRLQKTSWRSFTQLDVTPYVEGAPSGAPFTPKSLWQGENLYVTDQPTVRLYRELTDELARPFSHPPVSDAIAACIDRSSDFVSEYLQAHFELDSQVEAPKPPEVDAKAATETVANDAGLSETADSHQTGVAHSEEVAEGDEADANETTEETESDDADKPTQKPAQPPKPTLIELYARQRGFRWSSAEGRFSHSDGRWIEKSEAPFNWEEHSGVGMGVTRLWVSDQKLASGVEIAAELWTLLSRDPTKAAIVVSDDDLKLSTFSGQSLLKMKDSRLIELYPSRYRLASA